MATYSIVGAQSELDAYLVAFKARDWSTAYDELMDYTAVYHGLFDSASNDGATLKLPNPKNLWEVFAVARKDVLSFADNKRVIVGRSNFGTPGA